LDAAPAEAVEEEEEVDVRADGFSVASAGEAGQSAPSSGKREVHEKEGCSFAGSSGS
jgi:hypothetical protein